MENNQTVHKAVKARGIDLGALPPEEDIGQVERRHVTQVRELGKVTKRGRGARR